MKKVMLLSVLALAVTVGVQTVSNAAPEAKKYAVVDVKKVVNNASSVKTLKDERQTQKDKVTAFIKDASVKLDAEKDAQKKEELKKKLSNDLKYMTNTFDQRYKDGLVKINNDISTEISKVGQEKQYDLILTTDAVLYGGENITNQIIKQVK